jgi:hypothetical protein
MPSSGSVSGAVARGRLSSKYPPTFCSGESPSAIASEQESSRSAAVLRRRGVILHTSRVPNNELFLLRFWSTSGVSHIYRLSYNSLRVRKKHTFLAKILHLKTLMERMKEQLSERNRCCQMRVYVAHNQTPRLWSSSLNQKFRKRSRSGGVTAPGRKNIQDISAA